MLNTSMTGQNYNGTFRYVDVCFSAGGRQIPGWCGGPWDFSQLDWEFSHKQKLGTFLVNGTPPPPKFSTLISTLTSRLPHIPCNNIFTFHLNPPTPSKPSHKKTLNSNYISSWEFQRIRLVKGFTFGINLFIVLPYFI